MTPLKKPVPIPGGHSFAAEVERMIRVNHAGEFGAKRIYAGQLSVLKGKEPEALIRHMAAQEETHFSTFDDMMRARRVRPTALMPVWHVAGYALGAATALLGTKAAMACTVAVETVIDEHYANQQQTLGAREPELASRIAQFRAEEREHHDTGIAHGAEDAPLYGLMSALIRAGSKAAIWLSSRV